MSRATVLDILIVYNGNVARSGISTYLTPFDVSTNESCNIAYAYFLTTCRRLGMTAALSSSADIIGAGSCRSYWTHVKGTWIKHSDSCRAKQIFDKFSPKDEHSVALRHLLFSRSQVRSFNSYSLFKLFFDKQKTQQIQIK